MLQDQKIEILDTPDGLRVSIDCPECGSHEVQYIDDNFTKFTELELMDEDADGNTRRFVNCHVCGKDFKLTYDYGDHIV